MPIYEYEHLDGDFCEFGHVFDFQQSLADEPLTQCPFCEQPVKKIISRVGVSCPKTDGEIRDMGFTKLVRRDDGVYENVTARDKESRYMLRDKPETMPNLKKIISD